MSHFHNNANIRPNAHTIDAWRDDITPAFAARIMAVATEVVSVHPSDPRTVIEQAGDAIDAAYTWAHPRRALREPDACAVGLRILAMTAAEGIDPLNGPPS